MTRTVSYCCPREFSFEIEVEDDQPQVTTEAEFAELYGPMDVGGDSMIVDEAVYDDGPQEARA